jgi:hypothetical protein
MDAWPEEMTAMQESKKANNEKFEVLQGTLISWMDIHQTRTEAMQEKSDTHLKEITASQEHMKEDTKVSKEKMKEEKETGQMEMKSIVKCNPRWRPQYTSSSPS